MKFVCEATHFFVSDSILSRTFLNALVASSTLFENDVDSWLNCC